MKLKKIIIMAFCLSFVMTCGVCLAACNKGGGEGGGDTYVPRNSNQWFTEAELAKKGLSTLPAPTGLIGDMSSDLNWYNDGYFSIRHVPTKTRSRKTPIFLMIFGKGERRCTFRTTSEHLSKSTKIVVFWHVSHYYFQAYKK